MHYFPIVAAYVFRVLEDSMHNTCAHMNQCYIAQVAILLRVTYPWCLHWVKKLLNLQDLVWTKRVLLLFSCIHFGSITVLNVVFFAGLLKPFQNSKKYFWLASLAWANYHQSNGRVQTMAPFLVLAFDKRSLCTMLEALWFRRNISLQM